VSIFKKIKRITKQLGQGKSFALWLKSIRPANSFDKNNVPPAPDYALNKNWATGISHGGNSTLSPQNSEPAPNRDSLAADVFYIHPTTFLVVKIGMQI
jgi:hypothetical protein